MLKVKVKDVGSLDKAIKMMKRKVKKAGIISEIREREEFTKPSVKKRKEKKNAIYRQKQRRNDD